MNPDPDTIVAISTPPGRGGIGIVRLSGPQARAIAEPLLQLKAALAPARARFARILDPETNLPLDEAIVTFFAAPNSYTAEDIVEIAAHGSPVLLEALVRACLARGARLAEPGEFTQRAFLAGRLDLTEAEAVNDLIHAGTLHQARVAAAQLGGSLARAIAPLKQSLVALIATLEAGVDFAEDDLDLIPQADLLARLTVLQTEIRALADTFRYGRLVREGFTLAIIGRPNAGKSSLFNRLLRRERAIVTAEPGTTRDPITDNLSLGGIPVQLIDTAGLRADPTTEAEVQGIARSHTAIAEADLILHVLDATDPQEDPFTPATSYLRIFNKIDLLSHPPQGELCAVSALTGQGIAALEAAILAQLADKPEGDSPLVTNLRQHQALTAAAAHLEAAVPAAQTYHELILLDLYAALEALDSLTGATPSEAILHLIFSTFCIGK